MKKEAFLKSIGIILEDSEYTCMIYNNESLIYTSEKRGVAPLVDFITIGEISGNYYLADKVIGKAAALLCVKAGIQHVYTPVVSSPASRILRQNGISLEYKTEVPAIRNRTGTGLCPMETLSRGVTDPEEMFSRVTEWLKGK